jgi:hypothetical protein
MGVSLVDTTVLDPSTISDVTLPHAVKTWDLGRWIEEARPPGAFWLAAFPRSGVTLARTYFAHCFGLMTGSRYEEQENASLAYLYATNPIPEDITPGRFIMLARQQGVLPVKTHELPRPNSRVRAIVVYRDGRRVMRSCHHFWEQFSPEGSPSLPAIIRGESIWGSWSKWIEAWQEAEDTIWVSYEQLVKEPRKIIASLSHWLLIEPLRQSLPSFKALHAGDADFFRSGDLDGTTALDEEDEELFWSLHGSAMRGLGYRR